MKKPILPIVVISALFVVSISILFQRQKDRLLDNNENRLCLNAETNKQEFEKILVNNAYATTKEDATLISEWLIDNRLIQEGKTLSNLASLNSWEFQIPDSLIKKKGGTGLKERLSLSYAGLECNNLITLKNQNYKGSKLKTDSRCTITVFVKDDKKHFFSSGGVEGVFVRLKQYQKAYDPLNKRTVAEDSVVACAETDKDGKAVFDVDKNGFYSVLPVREGFQYGSPKGTTSGEPIGKMKGKFTFIQREHKVRMFDKATFARMKADNVFCVRTISDYITELVRISSFFLLAWWCTFFYVRWQDKRIISRNQADFQPSDTGIISILMLLNAICLFMMLAITNPLTDKDYANEMIIGTLLGCLFLCIFSSIDFVKYYAGQYRFKFDVISKSLKSNSWIQKNNYSNKIPEGIGFIFGALFLVLLLGLFGTGPEGSTAKVNLLGVQPSEVSKYLFVMAIAIFFTENSSRIQAFADGRYGWHQIKTLVGILIAVLILLILYVGLISDMGPALVLAVTFIIMYSILRQDLKQMVIGVFSYIAVLCCADYLTSIDKFHAVSSNSFAIVFYLSVMWFVIWFVGGLYWKKKIYESAGVMNLLILLFTHGGELLNAIGLSNQGKRLMDRIAASGDGVWDNTVKGGDQVAQGIWALASGGFWGQGLGNGNANLVPAFHTDMIFESIGEVMGFVTLVVILFCYAMLIRKCLIRAKESGHPFLFYLISGIAIVTVVQLFVIVMGSLGIVPLTGVSLPFLSYGKAGLIVNLAVFGAILSMSRNKPTLQQKRAIIGYNSVIKSGITIFALLFVVVIAYAFNYQVLSRNTYLTKPAYITNLAGEHFPEQNPRIGILLRKIHSGNIYDRNGLLLATSSPDTLLLYKDALANAGIPKERIDSLSHTSRRRYYPFDEHLFFMLGDMNTRNLSHGVFSKNPYGYLAEERHIDSLRGLSIPSQKASITRINKVSPYLPDSVYKDDWDIPMYGENETVVRMLKDGVNGNLVKEWNEKRVSRDIKLTIDANLQMKLQKALSQNSKLLKDRFSRVSLVLLNAESGDLLCSANYPLPNQDQIVTLFESKQYAYRPDTLYGRYTERDLGLTFQSAPGSTAKIFSASAGLEKTGKEAQKPIYINKAEIIHVTYNKNGTVNDQYSEPYTKPNEIIDMKKAIVKSSNCFFINLVHKERLYDRLAPLYLNTGIGVGSQIPYIFNISELSDSAKKSYIQGIDKNSSIAYKIYDDYISKRGKNGFGYKKMNFPECAMSWGQGIMIASPLNMARMVSIVANNGVYSPTRYLLGDKNDTIRLIQSSNSEILKNFMYAETEGHPATKKYAQNTGMGGKTGTPTRIISSPQKIFTIVKDKKKIKTNKKARNDGWYICFFNSKEGELALALRIEQCGSSSVATQWINEVIMPTLKDIGYINY